jgi:hypothetical protein
MPPANALAWFLKLFPSVDKKTNDRIVLDYLIKVIDTKNKK